MFGLSLGKVLLLLLVLGVLWYGVKLVTRAGEVRETMRRAAKQASAGGGARAVATEDLIKCQTCGAFVPSRNATACGRGDCPWKR
jgi:hypothetical protein